MKIVYAGTPDFAVLPLKNLIDNGFEVVGVVTQTDKPQGRKGVLTPPPVKVFALERGIPVLQPERIREDVETVRALGGDMMITCAYGQILTQAVLDCFPQGVWNIHAGLLPKYRGASPIQSCILAGETETGGCVMKTELGLDCGDILLCEKTPITPTETYGELSDRLSAIGADLIVTAVKTLATGNYTLIPQGEEGVQTVSKINKEQAKIDFSKTVQEVVNLVRGMNPAPVAYTAVNGVKLNVYKAEKYAEDLAGTVGEVVNDIPKKGLLVRCQNGVVKLTEVQLAGGKRMSGGDLLNGRKVARGQVLYVE